MKTLEEALHEGPSTIKQLSLKIGKSESRTRELIAENENVEKDTSKKPVTYWLPDDDVVDETEVIDDADPDEEADEEADPDEGEPAPKKKKKAASGNLNPQPAIDAAKEKVKAKGGSLEWKERKWVYTTAKGTVKEMSSQEFADWRQTL